MFVLYKKENGLSNMPNSLKVFVFCIKNFVNIKKQNKLGRTIFAQTEKPLYVALIYACGLIAIISISIIRIMQNIKLS
jgi:hypothetical protein